MADGKADDVGLDSLEAPEVPVRLVERDAGAAGEGSTAGRAVQYLGMIIVGALVVGRFLRDVREIGSGQRIAVAQHGGPEQGVLQLADIARPAIGHEDSSEERRVGKESVSTVRSRWSP